MPYIREIIRLLQADNMKNTLFIEILRAATLAALTSLIELMQRKY